MRIEHIDLLRRRPNVSEAVTEIPLAGRAPRNLVFTTVSRYRANNAADESFDLDG